MDDRETYLRKSRAGVFHFRRRVPDNLRPILMKAEVHRSLRTRNYRDALVLCRACAEEYERYFQYVRRRYAVSEKDDELYKLAKQTSRHDLTLTGFSIPTPYGNISVDSVQLDPDKQEAEMLLYDKVLESTIKQAAKLSGAVPVASAPATVPTATTYVPAKLCSFAKLIEQFIRNQKDSKSWSSPKTETGNRGTFALFQRFFGDRQVHLYSRADAQDFRGYLQKIPAGWMRQKDTRDLTYEAVIKLDKPKLTSNAVRDHLIRMNAIFQFAKVNDFVNINIFEGVNVKKQDVNRGPWSKEELEILFAKSNFQTFIEPHSRTHYWVPLVAAFTGARRSELFYLTPADICKKFGIWTIDINANGKKVLKNSGSARLIPIHERLIDLGFLDYVEMKRKQNPNAELFDGYDIYEGQAGYKFSDSFGDWLQSVTSRLPQEQQLLFEDYRGLHSFRHLFIRETREIGIPEEISERLSGHAGRRGTIRGYGGPKSTVQQERELREANEFLQKMNIADYFPKLCTYEELMKS